MWLNDFREEWKLSHRFWAIYVEVTGFRFCVLPNISD
jgi:hypothetical protein